MANTFLNENILFFGAGTMSSAHINPDIKLMLVVLEITVNYTVFAFQVCFPQFHCHPDHIKKRYKQSKKISQISEVHSLTHDTFPFA